MVLPSALLPSNVRMFLPLQYSDEQYLTHMCRVPAIPMFIALFYLPFSPRWLAGKGRDQEALETLCFLRRLPVSDPRVQAEWITIRAEAVHNRESLVARHPNLKGRKGFTADAKLEALGWIDMFKPNVIRRTMIGISIMFFQQFVGINAVSTIYHTCRTKSPWSDRSSLHS